MNEYLYLQYQLQKQRINIQIVYKIMIQIIAEHISRPSTTYSQKAIKQLLSSYERCNVAAFLLVSTFFAPQFYLKSASIQIKSNLFAQNTPSHSNAASDNSSWSAGPTGLKRALTVTLQPPPRLSRAGRAIYILPLFLIFNEQWSRHIPHPCSGLVELWL